MDTGTPAERVRPDVTIARGTRLDSDSTRNIPRPPGPWTVEDIVLVVCRALCSLALTGTTGVMLARLSGLPELLGLGLLPAFWWLFGWLFRRPAPMPAMHAEQRRIGHVSRNIWSLIGAVTSLPVLAALGVTPPPLAFCVAVAMAVGWFVWARRFDADPIPATLLGPGLYPACMVIVVNLLDVIATT